MKPKKKKKASKMVRTPAAAGTFYSLKREDLIKELEYCFKHKVGPGLPGKRANKRFIAGVSPHAGYVYSGPVAAHLYKRIAESKKMDTFIILGPNHTGVGAPLSIFPEGSWATPLGQVEIDSELVKELVKDYEYLTEDETAHAYEHSIEVQVPFLQFVEKKFKIVPICMGVQDYKTSVELGQAIARLITRSRKKIGVIASSDWTHYQPDPVARENDLKAIKPLLDLNTERFFNLLVETGSTACGYGPMIATATYASTIGAKKGKLLKYATSGDTYGDKRSVVGYAAIEFE